MATLDLQVGANADDTWHSINQTTLVHTWSVTATSFGAGYNNAGQGFVYASDARFTSITVGQANIINVAYMTPTASGNYSGTVVRTNIQAVDEDNAAIATSDAEHDADPLTTALTAWDSIGSWVTDTEYQSPSIVSVVQEIVDRVGWASGNAMVLRWGDDASDAGAFRIGYSYNGSTTKAAKLHIEYTAGGVTFVPRLMVV